MKKKLAIVILAIIIVALWVTPAFAAQGQITEVNPSGIGTAKTPRTMMARTKPAIMPRPGTKTGMTMPAIMA